MGMTPGRNAARDEQIYRAYIGGTSAPSLAEQYELTTDRIYCILREQRALIPPPDRAEMVADSLRLIREVRARAMELVEMIAAPVAVGKDGDILRDPESGAVVRDYSGRLTALALALKTSEVEAKRMGLDSPTKVETMSSVRYEIVGVDPEDLS